MQTSQVASSAFPRAGGAETTPSGTSLLSTQNPPADFEQIMRQSAGRPPQRSSNDTGGERSSKDTTPTRPTTAGVNQRVDAHTTPGANDANVDAEVNAADDLCPTDATGSRVNEMPGMAGSRVPALLTPQRSVPDESSTQGGQSADAEDGATGHQKETPTDQTRRLVDAGVVMLPLPTPAEVTAVKLPAGEANQSRTAGDAPGAGQNQEAISAPGNSPGRAPESLIMRRLANPVPPSVVAVGLTNNAVQFQPAASMPARPPIQPAQPASSGTTPAPTAASSETPALNKTAAEAAKETSPARDRSAATTNDTTPGRAPAAEASATPARSTETTGLRALNFARFQNLAEDAAATVSPALMRRTRPQPLAGIGVAKEESGMDKRLEQNQFADRPEQKLPAGGREVAGRDAGAGSERALPRAGELPVDRSGKTPAATEDFAGTAFVSATGLDRAVTVGDAAALDTSAGSARTAGQLLQNLTREVAQFKHFNAESMAVVLKPDANTEIFLHMVSHGGQIEIQARFDRGDFHSLNGQWAQLQQTLSQQGVRLSGLQEGFQQPANHNHQPADASPWGHEQTGQQNRQQPRHGAGRDAQPDVVDEFVPGGAAKNSAKRPEGTRRPAPRSSLEAWA